MKRIITPWADSGTKNTVPDTAITPDVGVASYPVGFTPKNATPLPAGGVPVSEGDMNGVLNDVTGVLAQNARGLYFAYDATFATAISGYPVNAILAKSSGSGFWLNITAGNTANPDTGGAGWIDFAPVAIQKGAYTYADAGGSTTAYTATYSPAIMSLTDGVTLHLDTTAIGTNTTTTPTFSPNGLTAWTIVKPDGSALAVGDLPVRALLAADIANTRWLLLNPVTPSLKTQSGVLGAFKNIRATIAVAATTATFTVDEIVLGTAFGGAQYRLSGISKVIDVGTTGVGGMDTGSVPVTGFVAIYLIYNPTTNTSALLAKDCTSVAATEYYSGANMPAGYTASALISVWRCATSKLIKGYQYDRRVLFAATQLLNTTSSATMPTSLSVSSAIPKNAISAEMSFRMLSPGGTSNLAHGRASDSSGTINFINQSVQATANTLAQHEGSYTYNFMTAQTMYYSFTFAPTGQLFIFALNYTF